MRRAIYPRTQGETRTRSSASSSAWFLAEQPTRAKRRFGRGGANNIIATRSLVRHIKRFSDASLPTFHSSSVGAQRPERNARAWMKKMPVLGFVRTRYLSGHVVWTLRVRRLLATTCAPPNKCLALWKNAGPNTCGPRERSRTEAERRRGFSSGGSHGSLSPLLSLRGQGNWSKNGGAAEGTLKFEPRVGLTALHQIEVTGVFDSPPSQTSTC